LVTKPSNYSVAEAIDRIEKAVTSKGMQIFARIDHGAEAKTLGLEMKPTLLLIFGNPKGGTALMVAKRTTAIDLPMKALAWQRHGVPAELTSKLDAVGPLLEQAVE
jgi:uncharacterized protein (DUF302 family)